MNASALSSPPVIRRYSSEDEDEESEMSCVHVMAFWWILSVWWGRAVGLGLVNSSKAMLQKEMRPSVLAVSSGRKLLLRPEELRWRTCVRQQVVWRPSWRSCH